ncbi:MAG: hypothetical protein K1X79_06400 [Oligoflexia bacterium]|nr:hypothetical protein [Oligoflexia bacterium]
MSDQELITQMERACLRAAQRIQERLASSPIAVSRKSDGSLVLSVDLESQECLRADLDGVAPQLSEEDPASFANLTAERFISIDPLDGTSACKRYGLSQPGQLGFGPLLGLYTAGKLRAAIYCDIPNRRMLSAQVGKGTFFVDLRKSGSFDASSNERRQLLRQSFPALRDSAVLFYTGELGEMRIVEALRRDGLIETAYRYGGFANDCARLALGYEDAIIQFYAKVWDFPAVLFTAEAGLSVSCNPLEENKLLHDWAVRMDNMVIISAEAQRTYLCNFAHKILAN